MYLGPNNRTGLPGGVLTYIVLITNLLALLIKRQSKDIQAVDLLHSTAILLAYSCVPVCCLFVKDARCDEML